MHKTENCDGRCQHKYHLKIKSTLFFLLATCSTLGLMVLDRILHVFGICLGF